MINEFALARALHVLGVVLWIGGVALVTTVLLPATRARVRAEERVQFFAGVESRFAALAHEDADFASIRDDARFPRA